MTDRGSPLPSTWIPRDLYQGPAQPAPGVLKLDGNEGNPPPRRLLEDLAAADLSLVRDYPDARPLESQIAERLGVDPARVVVTAGADEALDRMFRAYLAPGRRLVLPVPAFEMMYRFAAVAGGEIQPVPWTGAFPTDDVIAALAGDVSLVVMISPNNPTGCTATASDLERVAEAASKVDCGTAFGAMVVLDHAYVEYSDQDLTSVAQNFDNVVTVRTFSKAWGLAGCRVGYAVAAPEVATLLRNVGSPFPVAGLSLAAVRAQLKTGEAALGEHVLAVRAGRDRLTETLDRLGVETSPSQGNFVFGDFGARCDFVLNGLNALGVRVRRFPHRPEIADSLRITVPDHAEPLNRLLEALEICLAPQALLFDLDGVIADVEESYRRCVLETAGTFGVEVTREELATLVLAGDANNDWVLTQRILAGRGVEASLDAVTEAYQQVYLGTSTSPGLRESEHLLVARDVLSGLADRLPLAIVTGRPREEAEWFLEREGLTDLFQAVVCMEDGPLKPDPAPVRSAASSLGVERAWMIGDTPDDIRAAAAAGAVPIGVVAPGPDPEASAMALREAGAATVIATVDDLMQLLP
ncbi:MAG: aminotransferase class I/II-fold pyridoxal phosphate-dependent enzyme [Gemmatimonadetes bacterium]|nr:aminotransferase class I/II-fold pyridoxal phosphate-dependent enzyme [Gemmatimonadota bacterium]